VVIQLFHEFGIGKHLPESGNLCVLLGQLLIQLMKLKRVESRIEQIAELLLVDGLL
jgi:hypothetical protein